MAYSPDTLTIDTWASPYSIAGSDFIKNIDETMNAIVTDDSQSLVNFTNAQFAKIPNYLVSELGSMYSSIEAFATTAEEEAWEAEAEKKTADSYATEPHNVYVKIYTSVGDGTFSFIHSLDYSALHYAEETDSTNKVDLVGDTMTGTLEAPNFTIDGDSLSPYSQRNHLINGNFQEWGYGVSFTPTSTAYFADHWTVGGSEIADGNLTLTKDASISGRHATLTYVSELGYGKINQKVEGKALLDKSLSLSFEIYVDSAMTIATHMIKREDGGGVAKGIDTTNVTTTGEWVRVEQTTTGQSSTLTLTDTDSVELQIAFWGTSLTALGTNTIRIRNIQFEPGENPTPFEEASKAKTLSDCRRYRRKYSTQQSTADLAYEMYSTPSETGSNPYIYTAEIS